VEEGGAAAGPLAGARAHPTGERAAVERPGGGAHSAGPICRRSGGELLLNQAPHGGGSTRTDAVFMRLGLGSRVGC
jgi:hypothetical protein